MKTTTGRAINLELQTGRISFITPLYDITTKQLKLEKKYSGSLTLVDGSKISFSSNIGKKEEQEDCLAVSHRDGITLLLVVDGIGGQSHGQVASYYLAKAIQKWFDEADIDTLNNLNEFNIKNILRKIILDTMRTVHKETATEMSKEPATTLNMSIILPEYTLVVNCGDSRTYTTKDASITLQTKDDSLVFKGIDLEETTEEERDRLRFHRESNIVTKTINFYDIPSLKVKRIKNEYDTICHVTDGVSGILSEQEIKNHCSEDPAANSLVVNAVNHEPVKWPHRQPTKNYESEIQAYDNSTAVAYTRKLIKQ